MQWSLLMASSSSASSFNASLTYWTIMYAHMCRKDAQEKHRGREMAESERGREGVRGLLPVTFQVEPVLAATFLAWIIICCAKLGKERPGKGKGVTGEVQNLWDSCKFGQSHYLVRWTLWARSRLPRLRSFVIDTIYWLFGLRLGSAPAVCCQRQ